MDNLTDEEREILKSEYYANKQRQAIVKLLSTISALRAEQRCGWCDDYKGRMADLTKERDLLLKEVEALRTELESTKETLGQKAKEWAKSFEDRELMLKEITPLRAKLKYAQEAWAEERRLLLQDVDALRADYDRNTKWLDDSLEQGQQFIVERDQLLKELNCLWDSVEHTELYSLGTLDDALELRKQRSEK